MSEEDPYKDNVIPFPGKGRDVIEKEEIDRLEISHQAVQDLVVLAACVNMSTTYKGKFKEECKQNVLDKNFPCSANCGCYTHMLSSMAMDDSIWV